MYLESDIPWHVALNCRRWICGCDWVCWSSTSFSLRVWQQSALVVVVVVVVVVGLRVSDRIFRQTNMVGLGCC
jgi:hypothetical protein